MNKIFAAAASVAGLLCLASVPASAAPLTNSDTARQIILSDAAIQPAHWRGYRHCHWRHGWRRCHGGYHYRRYYRPYYDDYGYYPYYYRHRRPGFSLYFRF